MGYVINNVKHQRVFNIFEDICAIPHGSGNEQEIARYIANYAKEKGCDVVLYGHTHRPLISKMDGVTLINPGSLRYPAGEGGSYCYLVVEKSKPTAVIVGETAY